jgi:glucokinase
MRTAIGVDVGLTKIATALVDLETGAAIERQIDPTPAGRDAVVACIAGAVARMKQGAGAPRGIGVGLPELIDDDGRITTAWLLDWTGFDLQQTLSGLGRIQLESDVRVAALGELRYGHGRNHRSMVYVTIGSGISFAFSTEGHIHRGAGGAAIHFGSSDLMPVCGACGMQTPFNLEGFASGYGLADHYAARTGRDGVDARKILAGAAGAEGETLLDQATTALASYLGQMINMLDPHVMVIGGGLGTAPDFFARLRDKVPAYIWAKGRRDLPLLPSVLGADTGVIGAAALFDAVPWHR